MRKVIFACVFLAGIAAPAASVNAGPATVVVMTGTEGRLDDGGGPSGIPGMTLRQAQIANVMRAPIGWHAARSGASDAEYWRYRQLLQSGKSETEAMRKSIAINRIAATAH